MNSFVSYFILLIGVVIFVPHTTAAPKSDAVRKAIENLRKRMPCGFPEYGVPPLAPFKSEYEKIEMNTNDFDVFAELYNARVDGLNEFVINDVTFSLLTLKMSFDINFGEVKAIAGYNLDAKVGDLAELSGDGDIDFQIHNFGIKGNLKLAAKLSGVQLKDFNVVVSLDGVQSNITGLGGDGPANEFINKAIERLLPDLITEQQETISKKIHDFVVPLANKELSKFSLGDIIRMITNPGDPVECISPESFNYLLEKVFRENLNNLGRM